MKRSYRSLHAAAILTILLGGCGGGTEPASTSALVVVSGDGQRTLPGGQVPRALTVRAVDASGNPRAGVLLHWTGSGGSRFEADTSTTNENGEASAIWLLGSAPGSYSASATDDDASVSFTASSANDALTVTATPQPLEFTALGDTASVWIRVRSADGSLDTLLAPNGWGASFPIIARPIFVQGARRMVLRALENGTALQSIRFGEIFVGLTVTVRQVAAASRIVAAEGEFATDTILSGVDSAVALRVASVDRNGYPMDNAAIGEETSWSSSNSQVASVTAGVVQTNQDGVAVITARFGESEAKVAVRVTTFRPTDIGVGSGTSCATTQGNGLACWGFRELGNNSQLNVALVPEQRNVPALSSLAMTDNFGCALDPSALTWCWGRSNSGALGNSGAGGFSAVPVPVTSAPAFSAIGVGGARACGLTPAGKIYCWGSSYEGAIGDGTYGERLCGQEYCRPVPTEVKADGRVFTQVTVGSGHSCALADDGGAYCWGSNRYGQLGSPREKCMGYIGGDSITGNNWCRTEPTEVATDVRFTWLSAGVGYTCGVSTSARLYCWGINLFGVFGNPELAMSINDIYAAPVATAPTMEFRKVFAGRQHTCATDVNDAAWCWGVGFAGQLGTGVLPTTPCANGPCERAPRAVVGGLKFRSITLTASYTCGMTTDDVAYCWGWGEQGALGTGARTDRHSPARVALQARATP